MNQSLRSRFTTMASLTASLSLGAAAAFGQGIPAIHDVVPPLGVGVVDQVGLHTVRLSFSEAVTIAPGAIRAWGVASGAIPLSTSWNAAANELTVTFDPAITAERVTLLVGPGVTGEFGDELDGEIPNPMFPTIPTGDGLPGGVAVFRWDVLQGDANRDGVTNAADAQVVLAALGTCGIEPLADPDFDADADLNVDGCVNVLDVQIFLGGLGGTLPPLDGTPPVIASISRDNGEPLTEDLSDLSIVMSEAIEADGVVPSCVRMRSLGGELFLPSTTALLADERTIACHFDPPLSSCGDYSVLVSSSLVDLSGEFFVAGGDAPAFTGSTPPPVPTLNPHPTATSGAGILLTGTIPNLPGFADAAEVRVQGIDQVVTAPVAGLTYSIMVPLKANNLNVLYVSAISPCGIAGAPVTTEVTRDNAPPTLTITFPADGSQTFDQAVSAGGFVSDTLNGFQGLSVTVNGIPAVVDVGVGQNGTWNAPVVPLGRPGQATPITVVASDALGNSITKSITITRQAIPRNAAFIEQWSGANQTGVVRSTLPQPIRVKVWKPDGTPWANKVVDFTVTQNDGRLSGGGFGSNTNFYQALTDASGEAFATWRLGSTAGCGNNRVEASAKDVAGVVVFSATALAAPASQINVGTGNNQYVETGAPTPRVLSAWVNDGSNPGAGVPVTFSVKRGGGSFAGGASQATVVSDATGHADVTFFAGAAPGLNTVEATFPDNPGKAAVFTAYGVARDFTKPTSFGGLVLDDALRPIGNVKLSLKFQDQIVGPVLTNVQGQFEFPDLGDRSGAVHVIVEGLTANKLAGEPIPPGVKFPSLGYESSIVPHARNSLPRSIHLPPMLAVNYVLWDGQSDVTLACDGIDGLRFTVKANSMTLQNGSHPTPGAPVKLSINKLHSDLIPMPMPDGVSPPFAAEFQPASSTFDPPVEVEFPNMSGLAPGATMSFLTFNHDTGEFEMMAPATVTPDGALIKSEPGTGLTRSGWHGPARPVAITGGCAFAGTCAQQGGVASGPIASISVNGHCPSGFTKFVCRPTGSDPVINVEVHSSEEPFSVYWEVDPISSLSGDVLDDHGTGSSFKIFPIILAGVRPLLGSNAVPNPPIGYIIKAWVTAASGTTFVQAEINQDTRSLVRQEYFDYYYFASGHYPPAWKHFKAPIGAGDIPGSAFNTGNYYPPDNFPVIINGWMQKIVTEAQAAYGGAIKLNSAYRNPQRNKAVNGVWNSRHQLGGAVDMKPQPSTVANKVALYRAVLTCPTPTSVLLEQDALQLFPDRWNPPDAPWEKVVTYNDVTYTVTFTDTSSPPDGFPDHVGSISPATPSLPSSLHFSWNGGGSNPDFIVWDGSLDPANPNPPANGVIDVGEPLFFVWQGGLHSIDAGFAQASHVHGDRAGLAPVGSDEEEPDEDPPLANWTFDVGGQSVIGHPTGAFFADNVSGIDGTNGTQLDGIADTPIRVTGSTVIDGVTTYGFSEFFNVKLDANVGVQSLTLTTVPPAAPVSVALSGADLLEVGSSTGLTLIATNNDGSQQDVTPKTSWSTYITSNPEIATVSEDGVVTGIKKGVVYISAFNNAAAAVKKIVISNNVAPTTMVGNVQLSDGTPVEGAVVFTPIGGKGVSDPTGVFTFEVDVGDRFTSLYVVAMATIRGTTYQGATLATPIVQSGVTDAGTITIAPSSSCNHEWLPVIGGEPGMNAPVRAYTVFDDGNGPALYAGGEFTAASGIAANHIARWDGVSWQALGAGIDGTVLALASFDDGNGAALYAGGTFTTAGGIAASNIASWNGRTWSALASGTSDAVRALHVYNEPSSGEDALFVGGSFLTAGGLQAKRIARWDGRAWSMLGTGMDGAVRAFATYDYGTGSKLYAGGDFGTAGGTPAGRVARWDGSSWSALTGGNANGFVRAMAVANVGGGPLLYVGGDFNILGGIEFGRIAAFNGSSWQVVGQGGFPFFANGLNSFVDVLMAHNDGNGEKLYAGGAFNTAYATVTVPHLAKWDGSAWSQVGGGTEGSFFSSMVVAMASFDDGSGDGPSLFIGGPFGTIAGLVAYHIARWDGSTWSVIGDGMDGAPFGGGVYATTVFDDGSGGGPELFITGSFSSIGSTPLNSIAKWNGTEWMRVGPANSPGFNGPAGPMAIFDDGLGGGPALYVGGGFTTAGGVPANYIARWNGVSWSALGSGLDQGVRGLVVHDDGAGRGPSLFVCGDFYTAGGQEASRIARWDGSSWHGVGGGMSNIGAFEGHTPSWVAAMATFDEGLGEGPCLFAGGTFIYAGGVMVHNLGRWNGRAWAPVGSGTAFGIDGNVSAMLTFDDGYGFGPGLIVGGAFGSAGGTAASSIARWDGRSFTPLGNGVGGAVNTFMAFDEGNGPTLYAGGNFASAGSVPASNIARWNGWLWSSLDAQLNGPVQAITPFDDGSGPAIFVGGKFATTAQGDSYFAKWGCSSTTDAAPRQPRPALARSAPHRAPRSIVDGGRDLHLKRGESLEIADETRRFGSIVAEAGATIRLTHERSHLIVTNLVVERGATFEWLAGTIEIDAGAWLHPYELAIGCEGDAMLVLARGAFVRAPGVVVCELGSLVGEGAVDAAVWNAGALVGDGAGLRLLGAYQQDPTGAIVASLDELDAVVAGRRHACSAVDALPSTTGRGAMQLVDVDGDGDLDLVRSVGTPENPIVVLWLDQGDGHFGSPVLCQSARAMAFVTIVDANGDGLLDVQLSPRDGGSDITLLAGGDVEVTR